MNFTTHRAKDSVPGGAAAGKPTAIPQPLLDRLNSIPAPQPKPAPQSVVERMPSEQFSEFRANILSKNANVRNRYIQFLQQNASKLHPDDLSELIIPAINSAFSSYEFCVKFAAISMIKYASESSRAGLYDSAARIINDALELQMYDYHKRLSIMLMAVGQISELPKNLQQKYVLKAIGTHYDEVEFKAVQLIKTLSPDLQAACIRAAFSSWESHVQFAAIPMIKYASEASRDGLYQSAAGIIGSALDYAANVEYQKKLDLKLGAVCQISELPKNLRQKYVLKAINSSYEPVKNEALRLAKKHQINVR